MREQPLQVSSISSLLGGRKQDGQDNLQLTRYLDGAVQGGDAFVGLVEGRSVLHVASHALQEGQAEVVHAHIAPPVPQLPGACTALPLIRTGHPTV